MPLLRPDREKAALLVLTLVYWTVLISALYQFAEHRTERIIDEKNSDAGHEIALARSRIEAFIYESIYLSDSLATVITLNPDFVAHNWEQIAGKLVMKSRFIRNLGMAPDNVISHVYPRVGNEKALGLDFRDVPAQYASVMKAKELQGVYLDGPLTLFQGGEALIARFPVFLDYPVNEKYWGSVSVVLDYQKLIAASGLDSMHFAKVALKNSSGVFMGDPEYFNTADLQTPIFLPNTRWDLAGVYNTRNLPLAEREKRLTYLMGGGASLVLYLSVLVLYRAYKVAHSASLRDELTQLPNRRYLMAALEQKLKQHQRKGGFTLLNIDLNGFKAVNDTLGHDAGDALLQHVGEKLVHSVRGSDLVSRVGGDEYLILLERITDEEKVQKLISNIQQQTEGSSLNWQGQPLSPSLSIGYAIFRADDPMDIEQLMAEADRKMYRDKTRRKEADI